jgi:oxalate decarboxylase/phosphoglucose isomerase-like protein (cupin superfamily)
VINLEPGRKTVIPANWHYTLVNTGKETLATIEMYKENQELHSCHCGQKGAGVYVIERNGLPEIVKNSQYKNLVKYATVDPESYATNFEMDSTHALVDQLQLIAGHCLDCDHNQWKQYLETANSGNFSF